MNSEGRGLVHCQEKKRERERNDEENVFFWNLGIDFGVVCVGSTLDHGLGHILGDSIGLKRSMTATTQYEASAISLPQPVPAHGGTAIAHEESQEIVVGKDCEEVLSDISDEELQESSHGVMGRRVKQEVVVKEEGEEDLSSSSPSSPAKSVVEADLSEELEDILYLRLMALRSMVVPSSEEAAANKSPVSSSSSSKSIEDEMEELLEEADQAAAASQSSIPPPPIIDIADSDEEKMDLYMKTMTTNMSFLAPRATKEQKENDIEPFLVNNKSPQNSSSPEGKKKQEEEFYSPTQSPVPLSPDVRPPGDDTWEEDKQAPPPVVDMELGSENEAEIQFFKHQQEEETAPAAAAGPPLGVGMSSAPQMLYNCDHYLYQEETMYQKEEQQPRLAKSSRKRMRKRKSALRRVVNSSDEEEGRSKTCMTLPLPPPCSVVEGPPPSVTVDSDDEEAMRAHLLSTIAAKRKLKKVEEVSSSKLPPDKAKTHPPPTKTTKSARCLPPPASKKPPLLKKEMPFEKLKQYFPNMVRPFIVPLNIPTSSEDDEEVQPSAALVSNSSFQANLDLLMKSAREGVRKRVPPPKPVRKNPPKKARSVSRLEKESLRSRSSIEHLPPERQKEYKMLLARIAMKEKKRSAEDPQEMRRHLLSKMRNLRSKIDKNKGDLKKKVLVEEESSKENNEPLSASALASSEQEVISSRQDVVAGLFKLSAQLSQFRSESEKLITAQNFLSELLKQVEETRKLITKKEERITVLRHVVKLSHLSMSKKRRDLSAREATCRDLGVRTKGEAYELPSSGSEQIKSKLLQIASNAKLCKKVNRPQQQQEISGVSDSLAHLRPPGENKAPIDPHREFCRFELLGKCNDESCTYQHSTTT